MTATIYVPGTEETDTKKIIMSLQQIGAYLTKAQFAFPDTFSGSTDVNTLDDYEEGSWTPVVTFATPGDLSVAYSIQSGYYTKIGRLVNISFVFLTTTFTHTTASGNMKVTGLPFTSVNDADYRSYTSLVFNGVNKAGYSQILAGLVGNSTELLIVASGMGVAIATVVPADTPTGGTLLFAGTGSYVV